MLSSRAARFDFAKRGISRNLIPLEESANLFSNGHPEEFFEAKEGFLEEARHFLPVPARKGNILQVSSVFEPLEFLSRKLARPIATILPSEDRVPGTIGIGLEGISELEAALARGMEIGAVLVRPDFPVSGRTMTKEERWHLLELAKRHDFAILEDARGRELRYYGEAVPTIKSLDEDERVALLLDYSDYFLPGSGACLWVAPEDFVKEYASARISEPSSVALFLARRYLTSGGIHKFLSRAIPANRRRLDLAFETIETEMPKGTVGNKPFGGNYLLLNLRDSSEIRREALLEGIDFICGKEFFPGREEAGKDLAWINFSAIPEDYLVKGLRLLSTFL